MGSKLSGVTIHRCRGFVVLVEALSFLALRLKTTLPAYFSWVRIVSTAVLFHFPSG